MRLWKTAQEIHDEAKPFKPLFINDETDLQRLGWLLEHIRPTHHGNIRYYRPQFECWRPMTASEASLLDPDVRERALRHREASQPPTTPFPTELL